MVPRPQLIFVTGPMEPSIVQLLVINIIRWLAGVLAKPNSQHSIDHEISDNVGDSEPARLGEDVYAPAQHIELRVSRIPWQLRIRKFYSR
jgi:hypothetical protein